MKSLSTRAIVLRRTNYGEADRILNLLTPEGRQAVMARGVRREKSKLAGGIELFAVSDVLIRRGKGDLGILTSARLVQFYRHIMEDYQRMTFAYEALKSVSLATETVDEPEWFDVLSEVLMALDVLTIDQKLVETWFYLRHGELHGRSINLARDTTGQKLSADQSYVYDELENGLRPTPSGDVTGQHIKLLRLIDAKPLQTLTQIGGTSEVIDECLLVARQNAAV